MSIVTKSVVVIGAGIAGLTAAFYLKRAGIPVTVYEARGRVGGRIYSGRNILGQGLVTELGGEFIDGSHKDMLRFAQEFHLDLIDCETPEESRFKEAFFFGGKLRSQTDMGAAGRSFVERVKRDKESLLHGRSFTRSPKFAELDRISLAEYLASTEIPNWLRDLVSVFYTTEFGLDTNQQSALNLVMLLGTEGDGRELKLLGDADSIERYKIKGGNDQIIQRLAKAVDDIQLNIHLEAIEQKAQSFYLHLRENGVSKLVVASHVIIAIPFSILRNCQLAIPLTNSQRNMIQTLRYGSNAKIIAGVNKRVWRSKGLSGDFTIDGAQTGWDSSRGQPGEAGSLTFFLGGKFGRDACSRDASAVLKDLLHAASAVYANLPESYSGKVHRQAWPDDPWVKGSYACFDPGSYTRFAEAFTKQPPGLFFVGEHLSKDFQGYMNGGAETGRRASERLIRAGVSI